MKKTSLILLILLLPFFHGCQGDRIYENYQSIQVWGIEDPIQFELTELYPNSKSIIGIRYNNNYPYRNLYVQFTSKDTAGNILEKELIDLQLFESKSGKPLGKGFGSTFTVFDTLPTKQEFSSIEFLQFMRVEELTGIEAVGLKIIKE